MEITLGQQYNVREKPTVVLYTYINRHAGTPEEGLGAFRFFFRHQKDSKNKTETMFVCVCVCVFSSHSFWTSSSLDVPAGGHTGGKSHRISHPPSFCGACLHFSREKDSANPFPRRP